MYKLLLGDCSKVLETIENDSIDLVVTSPPYDSLRFYTDGYQIDYPKIIKELYRIMKQGGVVVWVVGDGTTKEGSETGTSFRQALMFMDSGFILHDTMIYEKNNFANPAKTRYHQIFEYMFVFSKGKPKTFNPLKDRPNKTAGMTCWGKNTHRQKDGSLKEQGKKVSSEFGMRHNIWRYITGNNKQNYDKFALKHPAVFPEKLAEDHILSWSNENDIILDPFCGAGTTGKMALKNKRNFVGIDISEEYLNLTNERINNGITK
jgi:site-specific DNA-methyltransferase (adenine-specific)